MIKWIIIQELPIDTVAQLVEQLSHSEGLSD